MNDQRPARRKRASSWLRLLPGPRFTLPLVASALILGVALVELGATRTAAVGIRLASDNSGMVTTQDSPSGSITSAPFSTWPNQVLVALLGSDGPITGDQHFTDVTGGNLTWKRAVIANQQLGDAEIWYAVAPARLRHVTVNANRAHPGYTGFLQVLRLSGANLDHPLGS